MSRATKGTQRLTILAGRHVAATWTFPASLIALSSASSPTSFNVDVIGSWWWECEAARMCFNQFSGEDAMAIGIGECGAAGGPARL